MKNTAEGSVSYIIIIVVTILVGIFIYVGKVKTSISDPLLKNPIFAQKTTLDTSSCDSIKSQFNIYGVSETDSVKSQCYLNLAVKSKDITICNKITSLKGQSPFRCYSAVAVDQNNISLCDKLPDYRSNDGRYTCYSLIGSNKNDYSVCDLIPDSSDEKSTCTTYVARNKGECEKLSGTNRDACYLYQSQNVRLIARDRVCETYYKEPKLIALCQQYKNGKITIQADCGRIIDPTLKNQCINYDLSSVRLGSPDELEQLPPMAH